VRKKWAEARREEEEDLNLSPWFIVKPFPVLTSFYSYLPLKTTPNDIQYISSPNKCNKKMPNR
jgi:hypothetical protein